MPHWVFSSWPSYISPLITSWVGDAARTGTGNARVRQSEGNVNHPETFFPMEKARLPHVEARFVIIDIDGFLHCAAEFSFLTNACRIELPWKPPRKTSPSSRRARRCSSRTTRPRL